MKTYKTLENGISIVEYDDTLAEALADMWNKSGDSWGGDNEVSTAEKIISQHSSGSFFNVFVAMYNGEAVGYCSFDRYYKDADTLYVHLLNVRPDFHGKKVGKELVLMCVEKTIELGYPRVDIHTWPGNTKAVPLYKKCGFLWEDRADTTHLSNFIPTVLNTELFKDFFEKADWYEDSTRVIDIKPDGVKLNKFEVYGYSWEKDGKNLSVGFEKTSRRMRYIETDDYKIEFMAENHELAFGLNYNCTFKVENKSGNELNVKIKGKNDNGIKFDYDVCENVKNTSEFTAKFYVEAIENEIDIWRMHPSILADIYINGKHAEFGLGIEPKFPLSINLIEKRHVARVGLSFDAYINVKSALLRKATIKFSIPKNNATRFCESEFCSEIEPLSTVAFPLRAEIENYGYERLDIEYDITLDNGDNLKVKKPLHIVNQGLNGVFEFENDYDFGAANGIWRVCINKQSNFTSFNRVTWNSYACFPAPKLGKPFDDEFNLLKPSINVYRKDDLIIMEATFESEKFKGIRVSVINSINAAGVISRNYKIENFSEKTIPLHLMYELWSSIGRRSILHYDGEIHEVKDNLTYGFSNLNSEKIDENWIFDQSSQNKSGIYWAKEYRPTTKWGDSLSFEHDLGELKPNECIETKPIVYISGLFNHFREFRNYVLSVNEELNPYTNGFLELNVNKHNPFINNDVDNIEISLKNNRLVMLDGTINLSSPEGLFEEQQQINPPKQIIEENTFNVNLNIKEKTGIYLAKVDTKFQSFDKDFTRALFIADKSEIITEEAEGIYTVKNGGLEFSACPSYSDALYSLKSNGNERIFSTYPETGAYAWWNPFAGGISSRLPNMKLGLIKREKITAEFVSVSDNFNNAWTGIKASVSVNEFEEHKGIVYEQFFVTMPSLPILCYFVKINNNTGGYKQTELYTDAFISGKDNLRDIYAEFKNTDNEKYRLCAGGGDLGQEFCKFAMISYNSADLCNEKLYIYKDAGRDNGNIRLVGDINFLQAECNSRINVVNKGCYTTRPLFFVLSEKYLTSDAFTDFERIAFSSK